jgi:hypothetical protein
MRSRKSKEAGGKLIKERKEEVKLPLNVTENCVRISTDCGLDNRISIPDRRKIFFSPPQCLDRVWDPPNVPSNCYRE